MHETPNSPPLPPLLTEEPDAQELHAVWGVLGKARGASRSHSQVDAAWLRLQEALDRDSAAPHRESPLEEGKDRRLTPPGYPDRRPAAPPHLPKRSLPWRRPLLAAAAVVALAIGFNGLSTLTVEAGPGTVASVTLPDGSSVELNSGSTLSYPRWSFPGGARERRVRLAGEAFFQVSPASEPFVVSTFNARVLVLGTRFNVRAREESGGGTEVALESGRVRLEGARGGEGVELAPGEVSAVPVGSLLPQAPAPAPLERSLAWRARGFAASDRPLGSLLRELERRFAVEIRTAAGVDLEDRLTVHYADPRELRSILADICTARGLRFRETSRGFEILQ